jgi:hypothetical protein
MTNFDMGASSPRVLERFTTVMRGLVPRIHVFLSSRTKTWMAVTSTAMTMKSGVSVHQTPA